MLIFYLNFKRNGSVEQVLGRTGKGNQGGNSQRSNKSKATDKLRYNKDQGSNGKEKTIQAEGIKLISLLFIENTVVNKENGK